MTIPYVHVAPDDGFQALWFPDAPLFDDLNGAPVRLKITTTDNAEISGPGSLIELRRDVDPRFALVLLFPRKGGEVSPSGTPVPLGTWTDTPGAAILGHLKFALPPDAVRQIKPAPAGPHRYELILEAVTLVQQSAG